MSERVVTLAAKSDRDHLRLLLGHHAWATLVLLDRCLRLAPGELELTSPGGYGSIGATLAHLVQADGRYQRRLLGEPLSAGSDFEDRPPVAALRAQMERQAAGWLEVLDRLEELDVTVAAEPDEDPPYPEVRHAAGLLLTQAIHHGNEHRAHVCSTLGANGLEVPDVSAWEYARLAH